MREAVGEVLGTLRADARDEVDVVKRDLEIMRREFAALREEVKLERSLRDLRAEVEEAQQQLPKFPAIASRLEAEQSRLREELDATRTRMRANQSIAEYGISKLRNETAKATRAAASVEMKLESKSSRFMMRDIDPAAAEALREFATQIVSARGKGGFIFPAGTA
jgi:chromosome segregation ATPase